MTVPAEMLEFVVCPQCRGDLRYTREQVLFCVHCRLCYPVEGGVPDLSPEAAMSLSPDGKILPREISAIFTVEKGKDSGAQFRLKRGTCKAIGRKVEDAVQTLVFNADFTMTLDDHTKKLISNYLSKSSGQKKKKGGDEEEHVLGGFKRLPDLILNDPAASRLHAMVFYDDGGQAGILDLVSKNGTFVNGREVETCTLKSGDEITIGATKISVGFR
ncbi:MAG: FHA domain-containing protein [Deltaproteobacteria bacterium]|nr:FHA domain-containing protein [Deltaproteobacteria bacterium]